MKNLDALLVVIWSVPSKTWCKKKNGSSCQPVSLLQSITNMQIALSWTKAEWLSSSMLDILLIRHRLKRSHQKIVSSLYFLNVLFFPTSQKNELHLKHSLYILVFPVEHGIFMNLLKMFPFFLQIISFLLSLWPHVWCADIHEQYFKLCGCRKAVCLKTRHAFMQLKL